MIRKKIFLLLWVAGIVLPLAGLSRVSPRFQQAFNTAFGLNWVHVVMHILLFTGLVLFLLAAFGLKPGWRTAGLALVAILLAAGFQEGLQALSQGVFSLGGSMYDLGVDLIGGSAGYGLSIVIRHLHRFTRIPNRLKPLL